MRILLRARRDLLTAGLAVLALGLFARLALRHVGDSYFLADQVDQLQNFEALLRLEPQGLWGPSMSGTTARALGPFGAIVLGLPVSLGLGVDAIQTLTSLFLVIATGIAFWQLARLDVPLAWTWLIVFTAMRMVWWNAGMLWVATVLLPLGLLLLALFAASLRKPSAPALAGMVFVLMLALHVHLAAVVAAPVLAMTAAPLVWRTDRRTLAYTGAAVALALVIGLLPYAIAEARTALQNTRAMFSHVEGAAHASSGEGRRTALETLVLASEPVTPFGQPSAALLTGSAIALTAFIAVLFRRTRAGSPEERRRNNACLWLLSTTVLAVTGQAFFFLVMARPLNGLHYGILLAPWYPVPLAVLIATLVPQRNATVATAVSVTLGVIAVGLLLVRGATLADRYMEPTPWTYHELVDGLDTLCAGEAVDTIEGPGLVVEATPSYDSVLRYLMNRGHVRCRYAPGAAVVIAANRSNDFAETIEVGGRRFARERVVQPGLARYRASP